MNGREKKDPSVLISKDDTCNDDDVRSKGIIVQESVLVISLTRHLSLCSLCLTSASRHPFLPARILYLLISFSTVVSFHLFGARVVFLLRVPCD